MRRSRLHITGASGSGTTTLGRAVADAWTVPHADADDYFWLPSDPPFSTKRDPAERVALMEQVFLPREAWVVSGSMLGWGDDVVRRAAHERWLAALHCPVLRLESVRPPSELCDAVLTWEPAASGRGPARPPPAR